MKKDQKYDIFISYRREGGVETAKHLRDILTEKGYRVFFDTDSLTSGDFNQALFDKIEQCKDFVIILAPGALDRCVNEGDWVRQELACALRNHKNIIPIMREGFKFPKDLPEDIADIRKQNGIKVHYEYFDAVVDTLISFLHSKPSKKKLLPWIALAAIVCCLAIAAIILQPWKSQTATPSSSPAVQSAPVQAENNQPKCAVLEVGGTINFGHYEQDNDTENGAEPIEWRVLSIENDRFLVISEFALDAKFYHESLRSVTWGTCTLRNWLNNDFLATAFTPEEQNMILSVTTETEDNPEHGTEGGDNARDRIFFLSLSECEKYFSSHDSMQCKATAYTKAQGCYVSNLKPFDGNCSWWLRSPGQLQIYAAQVSTAGSFSEALVNANGSSPSAVRPALWLRLSD